MRKHFTLYAMIFLLAAAIVGGFLGGRVSANAESANAKDTLFKKYSEVLSTIEKNCATKPDDTKLIYKSIRNMLLTLDPHSSFFSPEEYKQLEEENSGRYYGLGIRIRALRKGSGRIVIVEPPFPGTPAAKVGLQAGDVIYKVNGQSIDNWEVDDVIKHLKGPKGTKVHITVMRPGLDHPLEIDVVRDEIPRLTINYAYRIRPNIGYIKIEHFSETTYDELVKSLIKLDIDTLKGLIIDLRENPGGYLRQAILVSQEFLPKGAPIVSTRGRSKNDEQKYYSRKDGNLKVPLIILINNNSASASEIVSGAIQDNDRGLIVGERSFGKGLVQSVYRLSDGSGLALTTGKYYTPSGRCLQRPYNGSIYDYYNIRKRRNLKYSKKNVKYTLSGRKVYGGGGIQPDVVCKAKKMNHFQIELYSKDVFFKFTTQAIEGNVHSIQHLNLSKPESDRTFEVTNDVLKDFKIFLGKNMKLSFTDDDFKNNIPYIKRGIKAELFTRLFGILAGFKIRAEGDNQIEKAIKSIPEARKMLLKTKRILAKLKTSNK